MTRALSRFPCAKVDFRDFPIGHTTTLLEIEL